MSKKNIVFLVIVCGVVAFFLAWFGKYVSDNFILGSVSYYYEGGEAYNIGNTKIDSTIVTSVDINWLDGDVILRQWEGTTLKVEEEPVVSGDADRLHYHLSQGGTLQIRFFSSREQSGVCRKVPEKKLTVLIPSSLSLTEVYVNVTSGNILCEDIAGIEKAYLSSETGDCVLNGCKADRVFCDVSTGDISDEGSIVSDIEAGTAAGTIRLTGAYRTVTGGTKAGNCTVRIDEELEKADITVTTGDLYVSSSPETGFIARYLVDNGVVDFGGFDMTEISKGEVRLGDGQAELKLKVRTGNLHFVKEEN